MPNITLSIPIRVYRKMKEHPEVKWSEIARKAIIDYLKKIEEITTTDELLEELGEDFKKELDTLSLEKSEEHLRKMSEAEWKRLYMILTSS